MRKIFDAASAEVAVPAAQAFEYLADGIRQGEWTLGCWDRERVGDDLFRGRSLYDGATAYVRVLPRRELLLVDFEVGASPDALVPRGRSLPEREVGRRLLVVLVRSDPGPDPQAGSVQV